MDIFPIISFRLLKLLPFEIEQIVLDLKRNPHILNKLSQRLGLMLISLKGSADHPRGQPR